MTTKTISRDDYLTAFALVVCGNEHYRQAAEFDRTMQRLLGIEGQYLGGTLLGEQIYDAETGTVAAFERALKADGFEVEADALGE